MVLNQRLLFLLLSFFCFLKLSLSQSNISGKIIDDETGEELIGASVKIVFQIWGSN